MVEQNIALSETMEFVNNDAAVKKLLFNAQIPKKVVVSNQQASQQLVAEVTRPDAAPVKVAFSKLATEFLERSGDE
jgi:hypothetical protein